MLPEDWKKRSVAEVCRSVSVGVVIKPSQYYVSASEGIKAFRSANVKEGQVNNSDWVYFSHKGHNENKKSELKTGDVLVVRTGYPGTACVVTPQYAGCNAIDVVIARPDIQKIIPTYLCLFTNSEYGKSQVANLQGGMAQKHLNVGAYQQVEIPLPPLPEQKKIAAILSTWDRAIDGTEKLLANSQQQKKALMQQLLTGKKRLPGFTGEWKTKYLGDIADIQTGRSNRQDSLTNGEYTFFDRSEDIRTSNRYLFDCEAVIVPGEGQDFVPKYFIGKFDLHQRTYAISCFQACDGKFIFYTVGYHRSHFLSQAVGSTVKSLRLPMFQKMPLKLPPLPEQRAIAAVLTTADEELTALESDLSRLRQEKKALMQQLLTGKRRVTVD
ncbi:restriction endonuclease subunit S [Acetobacter malorum]|uniref:Restriction endonuclease subunit S n=1 Tax=Acetobacter malorum TaxID=178901 RepID=A0A149S772_9PROT|nr:restriction endonuclease subunit S [Acetobacter malorum]KXV22569.1 restriction endonuclease subunit S [Acetobacter malorum]